MLVGHSYGGFVMTNAPQEIPTFERSSTLPDSCPPPATRSARCHLHEPGSGLADPANPTVRQHPTEPTATSTRRPSAGFSPGTSEKGHRRHGREPATADLGTLTQPSGTPAWETIPSWFVVATKDRTIPPATQRFMAQRAGATTVEIASSYG